MIDICHYCGIRKLVHFDKDVNCEKLTKICDDCEKSRIQSLKNIDKSINIYTNTIPYTQEEMETLRTELARLKYIRLHTKQDTRWWRYPN